MCFHMLSHTVSMCITKWSIPPKVSQLMFRPATHKILAGQYLLGDICMGAHETFRAIYNMSMLLAKCGLQEPKTGQKCPFLYFCCSVKMGKILL